MHMNTNGNDYDILFLHPPSNFNKQNCPLGGVFPAEAGTNDLFLHPPIGVMALYHRLKSGGFNPGFINIGRQLHAAIQSEKAFQLDRVLKNIDTKGFGIDLHWSVHTPGALELAESVKKIFPDSFIFIGGLTATYFYRELLQDYPFIDAVVLGEADEAIIPLVTELKRDTPHLNRVPNLAYRNPNDNAISFNPVIIPKSWETNSFQSIEPDRSCAYITIKGCGFDCSFCGGSKSSYENFFFRPHLTALPPDRLVHEIQKSEELGFRKVFLLGDLRMMGNRYVDSFFHLLNRQQINITIQQELFSPASPDYLERWKTNTTSCSLIFSPESGDPDVRQRIGKHYDNDVIREMIDTCSQLEIPLALCYMFALPGQDFTSIHKTMDFIEESASTPYIDFVNEPMLIFDPASPIFENPDQWGYHIDCRTIKTIREYLSRSHWSQSIGYHTQWLSKAELVEAIFYVAQHTNRIRLAQQPAHALLHLMNIENHSFNRDLVSRTQEPSQVPDSQFQQDIIRIVPPYLRTDNLLNKDRLPRHPSSPYHTFRYLAYLLLKKYHIPEPVAIETLKQWGQEFRPQVLKTGSAPLRYKQQVQDFIQRQGIQIDPLFLDNLLDFEWVEENFARRTPNPSAPNAAVSAAADSDTEVLTDGLLSLHNSAILKRFDYDFIHIDWQAVIDSEDWTPHPQVCYFLYVSGLGYRKVLTPDAVEILRRCDGTRNMSQIIEQMQQVEPGSPFATAMTLGKLLSEGIIQLSER